MSELYFLFLACLGISTLVRVVISQNKLEMFLSPLETVYISLNISKKSKRDYLTEVFRVLHEEKM